MFYITATEDYDEGRGYGESIHIPTCHVWHPGLTPAQLNLLEFIQEHALAMIFPGLKYVMMHLK